MALVFEALRQSGLSDTVFVPLDSETTPYDTYCLWKTVREHPALAWFVDAVRASARVSDNAKSRRPKTLHTKYRTRRGKAVSIS